MNDYDNCIFACLHILYIELYVTFFSVCESYDSQYGTIHDSENQISNTLLVSQFNYHA